MDTCEEIFSADPIAYAEFLDYLRDEERDFDAEAELNQMYLDMVMG